MTKDGHVRLRWDGSAGFLEWTGAVEADALEAAIVAVSEEAGPRRLSVEVPADARSLRRALHRHGFLLEGVARAALEGADGTFVDVARYARLLGDHAEPRHRFTAVMNTVIAKKRLIAHVLVTDEAGRVLLCETSFKPDWELPGGIVEPLESPRAGAQRELVEEIGTELDVGVPLVVDWLPPYLGWEDALEVIFDCRPLTRAEAARLDPDGVEILALHWVGVAEAAARMTEVGGRHVRAAFEARGTGRCLYLEAGRPVAG